jgi:hypothetical protein
MLKQQHPSNNTVLGAPPGMSHEQCEALPVTRLQYADGTPAVASYWKPSPAELDMLLAGNPVRLICLGRTQPPVILGVDGDGVL